MSRASKGEDLLPVSRMKMINEVLWNIWEALKVTVLIIYYYFEAFFSMFCDDCKDVAGKIVLITGSANGLGREIAVNFARLGAILVFWDIDEEGNKKTSELVKRNGALAVYTYKCDLRNREDVYAVADQVKMDVGDVDILINDAGIMNRKNFIDLSDADIEKTVDVNISAQFWTCKAFLPSMIACNNGHLVTLSSVGGFIGINKLSDYNASKAAETCFFESLAFEMYAAGKKGIKTTIICPSFMDTRMTTGMRLKSCIVPLLNKDYVAQKTVDAILKERFYSVLPAYLRILAPKTLLPKKALFLLADYLGFFTYMDQISDKIVKKDN